MFEDSKTLNTLSNIKLFNDRRVVLVLDIPFKLLFFLLYLINAFWVINASVKKSNCYNNKVILFLFK